MNKEQRIKNKIVGNNCHLVILSSCHLVILSSCHPCPPRPLALLLNKLADQPRPAGLVARAEACASVGVKVLVEQQVVAPVRVVLEDRLVAEDRAPPSRI